MAVWTVWGMKTPLPPAAGRGLGLSRSGRGGMAALRGEGAVRDGHRCWCSSPSLLLTLPLLLLCAPPMMMMIRRCR